MCGRRRGRNFPIATGEKRGGCVNEPDSCGRSRPFMCRIFEATPQTDLRSCEHEETRPEGTSAKAAIFGYRWSRYVTCYVRHLWLLILRLCIRSLTLKGKLGAEGRGEWFRDYPVIRDVLLSEFPQLLSTNRRRNA